MVPSQWEETFGLVAVEAMAVGTAPVVPDRGSFPELVRAGEEGHHYAAGQVGSLAAAFAAVDADPGRFTALGRAARTAYELRHRAPHNLERLLEIYAYAVAHPVGGAVRVG